MDIEELDEEEKREGKAKLIFGVELTIIALISIVIIGAFCFYEYKCGSGNCSDKLSRVLEILRD